MKLQCIYTCIWYDIWYTVVTQCSVDANPVKMTCTNIDTFLLCIAPLYYIKLLFLFITVSVQVLENRFRNTIIISGWYDMTLLLASCNYDG